MDPVSQTMLQQLVRQEGRSLLQYVSESFPYTTHSTQPVHDRIMALAEEERAAVANLARFLQKNHLRPPFLGAYPTSFTTTNFVSLTHLVPQLIAFNKTRIGALEQLLQHCQHDTARNQIRPLLDLKRRHLQILEELTMQV